MYVGHRDFPQTGTPLAGIIHCLHKRSWRTFGDGDHHTLVPAAIKVHRENYQVATNPGPRKPRQAKSLYCMRHDRVMPEIHLCNP